MESSYIPNSYLTSPCNATSCNVFLSNISFSIYNYDYTLANDLSLEITADGISYYPLSYFCPIVFTTLPNSWTPMVAYLPFNSSIAFAPTVKIRFKQNSNLKIFRIDDLDFGYVFLLPIKVNAFNGLLQATKATINWEATSNTVQDKYELQSSIDGINFGTVNTQQAKGNGTYQYNYIDANMLSLKKYYRLKIIASNNTTYSSILTLQNINTNNINIYPTILKNDILITMHNNTKQMANFKLINANGSMIWKYSQYFEKGITSQHIALPNTLANGIYYINISTTEATITTKIIVAN